MSKVKLNKRNYKMFAKSNILNAASPARSTLYIGYEKKNEYVELLNSCAQLYNNFQEFRDMRARAVRYLFGDQWGDPIVDPETGKTVREDTYIRRQGLIPLKTNVMRKLVNSVLGLYANSQSEPIVVARDRDEAKASEMMTVMLQYVCDINSFKEIDRRGLEEALISAIYVSNDQYIWDNERGRFDVYMSNENPNNVFFNSSMLDVRMRDIDLIGVLRDYSFDELKSTFAKNKEQEKYLSECYRNVLQYADYRQYKEFFDNKTLRSKNFYMPQEPNKCRVIEVWKLETKERLRVHDTLTGELYKAELSEKSRFDQINAERIDELVELGGVAEEALLIEYEEYFDRYWYYRYLTPDGTCLKEGETPFAHKSHPFVITAYPLIDGEIHSKVYDVIDQQRYINRYITQRDIINGVSMKGLVVYDKQAAENAGTKQYQIDRAIAKPGASIAMDMSRGLPIQQITSNTNAGGDMAMVNMMLEMVSQIFGSSAAMRGEKAQPGTPASLYAQEAENSNNNISDLIAWYNSANSRRFVKILKLIQQYYTEPMYINIAGKNYSEEAKSFDPTKIQNIDFDVTVSRGQNSLAYRMESENMLQFLVQSGLLQNIDMAIFYAENSQAQFSQQLAEKLKQYKETMQQAAEEQQQAMAMAQQGGQPDMQEQMQEAGLNVGVPQEEVGQ